MMRIIILEADQATVRARAAWNRVEILRHQLRMAEEVFEAAQEKADDAVEKLQKAAGFTGR